MPVDTGAQITAASGYAGPESVCMLFPDRMLLGSSG